MPSIAEALALNLKRLRLRDGLSQAQLGEKIGVTMQTINRYETQKGSVSLETIGKLAHVLGVEETDLVSAAPSATTPRQALEVLDRYLKEAEGRK